MDSRSTDPFTTIVAAVGWTGVAAFSFWLAWRGMGWLYALPIGLMLALVAGGYAIESFAQELTIRRWAIGQLVFTVFAIVFLIAGIFNVDMLNIARWVFFAGAAVFALSAVLSAIAAKDLF